MSWYLEALKKYATFRGRSRRKEYWYFTLFNMIVMLLLMAIDGMMGSFSSKAGIGFLSTIYSLAVIIPGIAVSIRRLHDTSRSGWWLLISFVPIVGGIVLLVFVVQDSKPGENEFGPNPKELTA